MKWSWWLSASMAVLLLAGTLPAAEAARLAGEILAGLRLPADRPVAAAPLARRLPAYAALTPPFQVR